MKYVFKQTSRSHQTFRMSDSILINKHLTDRRLDLSLKIFYRPLKSDSKLMHPGSPKSGPKLCCTGLDFACFFNTFVSTFFGVQMVKIGARIVAAIEK